ncbi:MAG: phosphoglycolate phosphatase [Burkholderiaceae bacterium]
MNPFSLEADFDAAILDLDGTLVDTLGDFVFSLNAMLDDLALPRVQRALVANLVGKGSEHLIQSTLALARPEASASSLEAIYPQAWDSYQGHYRRINGQHAEVYPGVIEGLDQLAQGGLKLACLTNKPTAFALTLLQDKNLSSYFDFIFGGDSFARKKPDPLPLLKTCEALGSEPGRTLMVGDSSNDAQAARAAGCPVLLVSYGFNHGQPIHAVPADGYMDSMAEL